MCILAIGLTSLENVCSDPLPMFKMDFCLFSAAVLCEFFICFRY